MSNELSFLREGRRNVYLTDKQQVKMGVLKRRAYILKKTGLISLATFAVVMSIYFGVGLCNQLYLSVRNGWFEPIFLIVLAVLTTCTLVGLAMLRFSVKTVKKIAHVPPVRHEQGDYRTADELVRASIEPTAAPDELLRAASSAVSEADRQLLLRADRRIGDEISAAHASSSNLATSSTKFPPNEHIYTKRS